MFEMCSWRSMLQFASVGLFCLAMHVASINGAVGAERSKRFLIFPRQAPTRYQFIGGIGIPADLSYESLTIGHVLKAEYWLPYNATVFRENPYWAEYRNRENLTYSLDMARHSSLRWELYEYIAKRLDGYGYNGQECVLKAICECNALIFMRQHSVFAELFHIFFSPRTSADEKTVESAQFKEAERLGRTNQEACGIYGCSLSLLDWVSRVLSISSTTDD